MRPTSTQAMSTQHDPTSTVRLGWPSQPAGRSRVGIPRSRSISRCFAAVRDVVQHFVTRRAGGVKGGVLHALVKQVSDRVASVPARGDRSRRSALPAPAPPVHRCTRRCPTWIPPLGVRAPAVDGGSPTSPPRRRSTRRVGAGSAPAARGPRLVLRGGAGPARATARPRHVKLLSSACQSPVDCYGLASPSWVSNSSWSL